MPIIEVENLTKKFGNFTAVDQISFNIEEGEIFGFLGPNGAGKTTALNMLNTLLPVTSGRAVINGHDIQKSQAEVRQSIGMVFQDPTLDDELTAIENMDFHGRMYGMPNKERKKKIEELLELVELSERKKDKVGSYSGGMRRRLEIARGIMHNPKVLFLDEPTLGLDPQTKNHLWEYISNLANKNKITIILTTHYMDEADKLSDTIAIIDQGKIIARDTPDNLKREIGGNVVRLKADHPDRINACFQNQDWVKKIEQNHKSINIQVEDARMGLKKITQTMASENIEYESAGIFTPTLEDVFLQFTGKSIRESDSSGKDKMRRRKR